VRREKDGRLTVLAAKYEGQRLNSPNDVVVKSDDSIYFTDPPYGFPKEDDDPAKQLKFNGVYRLAGGRLQLRLRRTWREEMRMRRPSTSRRALGCTGSG
jgi:gluconolactonase